MKQSVFYARPEPWSVDECRRRAEKRLPRPVFDFIEGGAEDETTVRRNRTALQSISLQQRVAVGAAAYDTTVEVLGERLALPVLLAPTGLPGLVHGDAELAAVRAAEARGTKIILSTGSSFSLEEVAEVAEQTHWFQLYPWKDEAFVSALVDRADKAGYSTLCITLDVPIVGHRERDTKNGFVIPPRISATTAMDFARRPRWLATTLRARQFTMRNFLAGELSREISGPITTMQKNLGLIDPTFSWENVSRIRHRWGRSLVVKGIMHPGDAVRAVEAGVDAIVVSNHGGRQLDGAPASIEALPAVVAAVAGRAQVLVDGGIRRGVDVVKARALGADACLIGRPWLYGLGYGGQSGVERVLAILQEEIHRVLTLIGCPSIEAVGADALVPGTF